MAIPERFAVRGCAGDICQQFAAIIFHDVNFAVGGPGFANAQRPPGGPAAGVDIDAAAHLEAAVLPGMAGTCFEAGRGIVDKWPVLFPVRAAGNVIGIGPVFAASFYDEQAVLTFGVPGLVPLELVVANETVLIDPIGGIGWAVVVEFVGPDEFIGWSCRGQREEIRNAEA